MHENIARTILINVAVNAGAYLTQYKIEPDILWGRHRLLEHALKPEGKPHFEKVIDKFKRGEYASPSEFVHTFDGFDRSQAISDLYGLGGVDLSKGALILANHSDEGPLLGYGQLVVLNYHFNRLTDREIRWVQGKGSSVANIVHVQLAKSTRTIHVDNKSKTGKGTLNGKRELVQVLGKEIIGICPEGDSKRDLIRGVAETGHVIKIAVKHGIPVFCVSTTFSNDTFRYVVAKLDIDTIKLLMASRPTTNQDIVDLAMLTIAKGLPRNRQGYYRNWVDLSDAPALSI